MIVDDVAVQIRGELDRAIVGPVGCLLGLDLADVLAERIRSRAATIAAVVCQDVDDRPAADAVINLMNTLWPSCSPEECGEAAWWRTPLGRMCARSLGRDDADSVTRSIAAAMLGVAPGTVARYVHDGRLLRHPDGGVTRASVLLRLAR